MKHIWMSGLLLLLLSFSTFSADLKIPEVHKVDMEHCVFEEIMHGLGADPLSTTKLRQELKVTVSATSVTKLKRHFMTTLGADHFKPRDLPRDPSKVAITVTDYRPAFRGWRNGKRVFSGVIRMRQYKEVSKFVGVRRAERVRNSMPVTLADEDPDHPMITQDLTKLEFKVGHPEPDRDGFLEDLDGVVDKPGIVLPRWAIDLLFLSRESFISNEASVKKIALQLQVTRKGKTEPVNNSKEVDAFLKKIRIMYQKEMSKYLSRAILRLSYKRDANLAIFKVDPDRLPKELKGTFPYQFELQLTIDRDIQIENLATQKKASYNPNERVVELKIPLSIVELLEKLKNYSPDQIREMGLYDLWDVYNHYLDMPPVEGKVSGTGKRRNGAELLGDEIVREWLQGEVN